MRKSLIALSAAAVIGTASMAAPSPAQAHAWWIVPAVVGGVLVSGMIAAAANPYPYGYGPAYEPSYYRGPAYYRGNVAVQPRCRIVRERVRGGWRRYEVCG
jgi:hypothetical protein